MKLSLLLTFAVLSLQAQAQTLEPDYKGISNANPISASVFCADPTAIDYNGRLYVYGTNDHQQFLVNNKSGSNGYGNIKSLVVFSTDDMVNWTFHGTIDVGKICGSWCGQSWAPSAVWRTVTTTKRDEFFIYFANGGGSVGVIKGASPIGPFKSPLSEALIRHGMPGVDPCNWVFDPGVVVDENGVGWIAFGGGDPQSSGSNLWPGNSRIAKLKTSMTALDGAAVNMPAPYLFEASELNIIGGRYVYTYNTSWSDRNDWSSYDKRGSNAAPSSCSMCYMVSDTPLDPDSWEYRGEYVPNEGNFGMGWGNNHTHLHKFQGNYYLFYHSTVLESAMNTGASGFRSIGVNKATVNESTQTIYKMTLNKTGVTAIKNLDPYVKQQAETMATCGGITYEDFSNIIKNTSINTLGNDASRDLQVQMKAGAWTQLRKVDFGTQGAVSLTKAQAPSRYASATSRPNPLPPSSSPPPAMPSTPSRSIPPCSPATRASSSYARKAPTSSSTTGSLATPPTPSSSPQPPRPCPTAPTVPTALRSLATPLVAASSSSVVQVKSASASSGKPTHLRRT